MKKDSQLANEIKKLQYQLSFSEHTNKELSQQLSSLQPSVPLNTQHATLDNYNAINTHHHLQELYYVQPLLMAYQHKIYALEEQVKQFREDSSSLQAFGEQIISENNFLRKQLETKSQIILKSEQVGLNVNFLKLDNQNLIEKNNLLKEKNNFLMKKINQIEEQNQREKINNARPNANINQVLKELRLEKQKLKNNELENIELKKKHELIANELSNEKSMQKQLERKNYELQNEINKAKNQIKIQKQQFQSYQISHEGTNDSQHIEIQGLKKQLSAIQRREHDLFNKNMALESQLHDKNAKNHNIALQNTQLQTNNNNILQMLQNYETKVNTQNKKIKQLEYEIKECNETFAVQRKESEIIEWKLNEKQKEVQRKQEEWRKQKERLNKMWEQRLQSIKKAINEEKEELFNEINRLKISKQKYDG